MSEQGLSIEGGVENGELVPLALCPAARAYMDTG